MGAKVIKYRTRDGEGRDIITDVKIKQYPAREVALDCPICGRHTDSAINVKDIVSSFGEDSFIRLSYITSKDLLNKGTAVFLKVNYPEQFFKLSEAWPEIKAWV